MDGCVKWGWRGPGWTISFLWSCGLWGAWENNVSISLFEFIHPSDNLGASRYLMALWSVWVKSQWKGYKFSDLRHELTCNQWRLGTSFSSGDTAKLFVSQQGSWFYTKTSTWVRRTVSFFKYGGSYVLQLPGSVGKLQQMVKAHSKRDLPETSYNCSVGTA